MKVNYFVRGSSLLTKLGLRSRCVRGGRKALKALTNDAAGVRTEINRESLQAGDEQKLEVRVATQEEMTTLVHNGKRLPNLLGPLSHLCARVLYGADHLQPAVEKDFQSRYGRHKPLLYVFKIRSRTPRSLCFR
jgi:hypothetical protein